MLGYMAAFAASMVFVGLKSTQQLNVQHEMYWWIVPTSMLMAVVEVFVVAMVAKNGWDPILVACVGSGSGFGSITATWLHSRARRAR